MQNTTRPTIAEIDLRAIGYNIRGIRRKIGKSPFIMAVVKANAYGHGIVEVATYAVKQGAEYLGVAIPEEGARLREAGLKVPIHVFTLPSREQARLFTKYDLEATVCSLKEIRWLEQAGERARKNIAVHLKVETGMNRLGVRPEVLQQVIRSLRRLRRLEVKGVFSHFATSDERNKRFAELQLERFEKTLDIIRRERVSPELIHMANSAAILDLPASYFSMVRAGMIMYGYYPSHETSESIPLKHAMRLQSKVSFARWIEKGESVGYGRRFVARRRTRIATVPIGYADGFSRMLSGKASVLIHGKKYPLAGTVAMDQIMVDVGKDDVVVGDTVVVLGSDGPRSISAWDIGNQLGTLPYEVCCMVSARVPRLYIS
ncbi:MAG TPA: alanine racemase [Bacteroidota bacterium]